ncbi:MAG: kumamolisin [Deltaproteobacteria bacterium]|nr:kumamolisin [Deltaproteobacteria bacterium]
MPTMPSSSRSQAVTTIALAIAGVACDPPSAADANTVQSGLLRGASIVYADLGPADERSELRALVALPIRDPDLLDATITELYDPTSPAFRRYLTVDDWIARHAPPQPALDTLIEWLRSEGFEIARIGKNRSLVQITSTVGVFNAAFQTQLHDFAKLDDAAFHTYGHLTELHAPHAIAALLDPARGGAIVVADPPADTSPLPGETGAVVVEPPDDTRLTLARVARAYGLEPLTTTGAIGQGVTIGVVAGAGFKFKDLRSFWQSQGIVRDDPELVTTMEPLATRFTETTIDIEWCGGLAPGADVVVYAGPDAHDTSLVFTFNEAIADGRAQVITDSFAHREDSTPLVIRLQYDTSARMAAALGITVVAAGGDSGQPDVPATSPFVTSVGGTVLELEADGARREERAWVGSGSGDSLTFDAPSWQLGLPITDKRAISDVALASGTPYWAYVFGEWRGLAGTSFASPVFAALVAVVDSARLGAGEPPVGFLNSTLYRDPIVQAAFHDVVDGGTPDHPATPGWDYPTGFGAPDAARLHEALRRGRGE